MKKTLSVSGLLAVVLMVTLAFTVWDAEKVHAKSTCPSGAQKFVRVCIEKSAHPAVNFSDASSTCAADGRRLPTSAELDAFRQQPGVVIGGSGTFVTPEWISNFLSTSSSLVIFDNGNYGEVLHTASDPFRCVM
jgi:hypothetical protein